MSSMKLDAFESIAGKPWHKNPESAWKYEKGD